jgi:hypothetical protein
MTSSDPEINAAVARESSHGDIWTEFTSTLRHRSQASVSQTPDGLRAGAPAPDFTLPSTADVTLSGFRGKQLGRRYGTVLDDKFFSQRAYFLVDKQGVLRWMYTEAKLGDRREDAELLRVIRTL